MTNYGSHFIDNYSTITEPLRWLTKQDQIFEWNSEQENAFNLLKDILVSDKVMTYFDPSKSTELWIDASPVGVSGILIQNNKIVSYGSRALSDVEQRYSQTEREALSCVWACEHFHLYLFGKEFTLITDHRPLESIFNNTKRIQSARLERWRLRLTTYNFKDRYKVSKLMISGYCSRHPYQQHATVNHAEDYVMFLAHAAVPASLVLSDIAVATGKDCLLKCVMKALQDNTWKKQPCSQHERFKCYEQLFSELSVVSVDKGTVLLRGTQLCIPESLQQKVVNLAHEGHQGTTKCKSLLRESCWFPYMDRLVAETIKNCIPCQAFSPKTTPDPIKISKLPIQPFGEISVDFCGLFPSGEYYMVVIDDYSRFPIVEKLTSLSAQAVILRLENVFSIRGICSVCRTDNGPPFNGHMFEEFAKHMGFSHRRSTPLHPMGNSLVKRFMSPLQKAIKTSVASGQNNKTELHKLQLNYRTTPHPATGKSPAEIMFGRKLKTKLLKFSVRLDDSYVRNRDKQMKMKNKKYADIKRKSKPCRLKYGDYVLVKRTGHNKLETAFHPKPAQVIKRKGSMIIAKHMDKTVTRDASHFKYVEPPTEIQPENQPEIQPGHQTFRRKSVCRREPVLRRTPQAYSSAT